MHTALPTGTVTFLLTDIENSTRLGDQFPDAMGQAVARHEALAAVLVARHGGVIVKSRGEGDSLFCVFHRATNAVAAACALQRAFVAEPWPPDGAGKALSLRVRMALHTGEADFRDGDYYGAAVNRCARLRAIAHGGQALLSQTVQTLVFAALPASATLRDLGEHRLKDLQQAEHVWQLVHPDLPGEFPPLRSLGTLATNLPLQTTSFIGRERDITDVKRLLSSGGAARLLTLTGSGGAGKTRLALQVAADVAQEYPDGVWLAELAPLSDPTLVPHTVAGVLDVAEEPGRALTQTLAHSLRPKRLLLVLDNGEHVLAACAALAGALLRHCPHVRILATSREALNVPGEQTYRVPPLAEAEAVRLFAERAALARPDFAVTGQNAPVLARLCSRLDGIPLALELAAARVRVLPVEQIEARLHDRFRLLTGGSRTTLARQQTLRALIDWSYDLLAGAEKTLLRRLSVFAGGWTLPAAEAVCADAASVDGDEIEHGEVLDLLSALVDKSLVVYEEPPGSSAAVARYRLLETVREYARDRLTESGEGQTIRRRHRDEFLRLAEESKEKLSGPEQEQWFDALDVEQDNLRAVLAGCLNDENDSEDDGEAPGSEAAQAALRLCGALWRFWLTRGHLAEGLKWTTALLAQPGVQGRTKARTSALSTASRLSYWRAVNLFDAASWLRVLNEARLFSEEALTISRGLGDRQGIAEALHNQGAVAAQESRSNLDAAQALHEEVLALRREMNDDVGIGESLESLGVVAYRRGDYAAASALQEKALVLAQARGDKLTTALALYYLGNYAAEAGDDAAARRFYAQGAAVNRQIGNPNWEVGNLHNAGAAALRQNALGDARHLFVQARDAAEKHRLGWGTAGSHLGLGKVAATEGDHAAACKQYRAALLLYRDLADTSGVIESLTLLATALANAESEQNAVGVARLFGAIAVMPEAAGAFTMFPRDQEAQDRSVNAVRTVLGEAAFAAAWNEGQVLTREQVVAHALANESAPFVGILPSPAEP